MKTSGCERGMTLTEVTITMVLASIVMLGLVGFYLSSQGTWMDASAKAITQREITTLAETIALRAHSAAWARTDLLGRQLELFDFADSLNASYLFWWDPVNGSDSLVHEGPSIPADRGSPITSKCELFRCTTNDSLIDLDIQLRSPLGERIAISTRIALLNRRS